MSIRLFQIIVPIIFILYLIFEVLQVLNHKKSWVDIIPSVLLSLVMVIIAVFPDSSTKRVAKLLGFKDNVNAILFVLIGILSLLVLRLFDRLRVMQDGITKLTIEHAILEKQVKDQL